MAGGNRAVLPATGAAIGLTGALSTGSLVLGLATMVLTAISIFQVLRPAPDPRSRSRSRSQSRP